MNDRPASPDLEGLHDATFTALRTALRAAAYDDAFLGRCEAIAPRMLDAVRLPVVHWWLRQQGEAAAVIARLWAYGDTVDEDALAPVLPVELRQSLLEAGLVVATDGGLRGGMRLMPFCGLWIASDEMHAEDPVMGPGATTDELVRAIPNDAGRVLDVGCGAGSLALVAAARGASEVVAVDLHPRAAQWTRFNARLNELQVETHTGDLTAPVKGRQFDLVVSQPPFVVKPEEIEATTYLHGGSMGDELTMRLVGELPSVLAPHGQARLLFDSPVREQAPLWRRLQDAHGDDELQQLLFVIPGNSPNVQAIGYAASSHPALDEAYATAVQRYRAHLHAQGIDRNEHALAVLRHHPGGPGMSVTVEQASLEGIDAATIAETWAAIATASQPEAALLDTMVGLPQGAWLVQEQAFDGSEVSLKLRLPAGRGGEEALSDAAALLIQLLAEQPAPLGVVVEQYAEACEATADQVRGGVLDFVRQSLVSGRLMALDPASTK